MGVENGDGDLGKRRDEQYFEVKDGSEIQEGRTKLETELGKEGAVMAMVMYLGRDKDRGRVSLAEIAGLLGPSFAVKEIKKILEDNNIKPVPKYEEEITHGKLYKQIVDIEKEIESLSKRQSQKKIRKTKELNKLKKRLKKFALEAAGIAELSAPLLSGELGIYQYDARLPGKWQAEVGRNEDRLIELVREHIQEVTTRPGGFDLKLGEPLTDEQLAVAEPIPPGHEEREGVLTRNDPTTEQ